MPPRIQCICTIETVRQAQIDPETWDHDWVRCKFHAKGCLYIFASLTTWRAHRPQCRFRPLEEIPRGQDPNSFPLPPTPVWNTSRYALPFDEPLPKITNVVERLPDAPRPKSRIEELEAECNALKEESRQWQSQYTITHTEYDQLSTSHRALTDLHAECDSRLKATNHEGNSNAQHWRKECAGYRKEAEELYEMKERLRLDFENYRGRYPNNQKQQQQQQEIRRLNAELNKTREERDEVHANLQQSKRQKLILEKSIHDYRAGYKIALDDFKKRQNEWEVEKEHLENLLKQYTKEKHHNTSSHANSEGYLSSSSPTSSTVPEYVELLEFDPSLVQATKDYLVDGLLPCFSEAVNWRFHNPSDYTFIKARLRTYTLQCHQDKGGMKSHFNLVKSAINFLNEKIMKSKDLKQTLANWKSYQEQISNHYWEAELL